MTFTWLLGQSEPAQFTRLREACVTDQFIGGEITGIGPISFVVMSYSISYDVDRRIYEGRISMRTADV